MADPKFNPDAPFQEIDEIPKFDPNKDFREIDAGPAEVQNISFGAEDLSVENPRANMDKISKVSGPEAGLRGAEQGLTMGFADELGGAIGAGLEGSQEAPMAGESKLQQLQRLYDEYRDFNRQRYAEAEQEQPGSYLMGDIAGSLLTPGGLAKKGGEQLAKAGVKSLAKKGAIIGGVSGGVEAAGRTEEDLTSKESARDVAFGTLGGAATGGLMGKIGSKFSQEALEKGSEKAAQEANVASLKSIGAGAKDLGDELKLKTNKRATMKTAKGTGQTLIDEDVLKMKQGAGETKEAIVDKLDEVATQRLQPIAEQADELTKQVPLREFSEEVQNFENKMYNTLQTASEGSKYAKGSDKALYSSMDDASLQIMEDVQNALESPNRISALVEIKRNLQKQVNWNDPTGTSYNEFLVKAQSDIADLINDMTNKASPELAQEMISANKTYSNLLNANRIAGDELARDLARGKDLTFKELLTSGIISTATDIPGAGPAVIGGKRVIENVTGKDTGKLLNTFEAFQKAKKAKSLGERAANYGGLDKFLSENAEAAAGVLPAAGGAILDSQKPEAPYQKNKEIGNYIETADPETLNAAAGKVREQYGKDGERLALTLQKVSQKDRVGRRALLFSILQDPNNRRMLGIDKEE